MAAVLEALVPYVKKMITDMAQEEVGLLLGVHDEMEKLGQNLGHVKAFLADAERRRIKEELVQGWVTMLKDVMYDATDVLELGQLKTEERRESMLVGSVEKKKRGCLQPFLFCLRNPMFAHKIGSRIKELNQRLEDIHNKAAKFNFTANLSSLPEKKTEYECSGQRMTPEFIPSAIVGTKIEADTKLLVQELTITTDENHNMKMVSIVGMGGMGKTTLAQKIFKDATIDKHFKTKIWLSITQHFDEVEVLRSAIKHAGGDPGTEQDNTLLTQTLTNTLSASKFLLVLDDIWNTEAWDSVLRVPITNASNEKPGSRLLVTTRIQDLTREMQVDSVYEHHVSPLDQDDGWSLLKNQLPQMPNQVARVDQLKDVGMKIIKRCGGLPLAIKLMGGLLRTKPRTELEWEAILNHHAWSLDGLPDGLDRRLYLSYEHLLPQLKQCFLYCSLFPKGTTINQQKVISMWISEGFVQTQDTSCSPEEEAAEYYRQLIMRNLIEPIDDISRYKCTMHDVVRSFAEFMATGESLVLHDERVHSIGPVRRLSIGSTKYVPEWALLQKQESLRTLIINCRIKVEPGDSLSSFSSLRVLSIEHADCDRLVDSLCQLRHLRYLQFGETNISALPDDIHRLKFLQHLVLRDCRSLEKLPSSIIKLARLRSFRIDGSNNVLIPKGFGALTNLMSLFGFPVHVETDGGWCSLEEIVPLSQLRELSLYGLENMSAGLWAKKATISSKGHLHYLELNCSTSRYMESKYETEKQQQQKAAAEVFEKLCPPTCVADLWIEGYLGHQLPHWMMIPTTYTFKSLRYLTMKDLPCCTQLPDGLCRLPSLEAMDIIGAPAVKSIGPEFQASSPSFEVGAVDAAGSLAAFPSLTNLWLKGLCEWEEWEWANQGEGVTGDAMMGMPVLNKLTIDNCKLSRLPPGLASSRRHTLRCLNLYELCNLTCVENFPSVVKLDVFDCPELKRISGLSTLQRIRIVHCPNLEVMEDVPALDSIRLNDTTMESLPGYLASVSPRYLNLTCNKKLHESLSPGSSEWDKISHITNHNIDYDEDSGLKMDQE